MTEEEKEIEDILFILEERQQRGNPNYYRPLDAKRSRMIREHYRAKLPLEEKGNIFFNVRTKNGVLVARGYTRVVIGDYGAYVEFTRQQAAEENIEKPSRERGWNRYVPMKAAGMKVYYQLESVRYADYKPGMYYISVDDVMAAS